MMRPPFRPPLSHEPGTDADHTPSHPAPNTRGDDHKCCGRPGCCGGGGAGGGGGRKGPDANRAELDSVAPTHPAQSQPAAGADRPPAMKKPAPGAKVNH
jgi:hypothetical protein